MEFQPIQTPEWVHSICHSPKGLTCFIALLAELEQIGANKIRCCVEEYGWGKPEQTHLGEESAHAAILRKILQKQAYVLSAQDREDIRQLAHEYFQPLDHGTSDHLNAFLTGYNPYVCYIVVSYLIECRAMEVYTLVTELCTVPGVTDAFRRIIEDESQHLRAMEAEIKTAFQKLARSFERDEFAGLEHRLFENLKIKFKPFLLDDSLSEGVKRLQYA